VTLFTQEKMRRLLDEIASGKSMSQATALAYGSRSKIGWVHVRNSKKEKDADLPPDQCKYWVYDWPEKSEGHHLCDAYAMAVQIAKLDFHMETLAEIRQSTRPVLEGGRVMYEVDHELVALYEGDADVARLCGVHDPFFKHDPVTGARIPLRVRDRTSAALTLKALAVVDPERWDRPTEVNVTKRIQAVLTVGEKPQSKQMTQGEMTLREKLEYIRANPNRPSAKPSGKVNLGDGARVAGDPVENVSNLMGDDSAKPLPPEPPRALPPPQPPVSYARPARPNNNLDRQDAPNHGAPPPGGFRVR
jgi:hypothetical protein